MQENRDSLCMLGVMSGSSLDGVDLALCSFTRSNTGWNFTLLATASIPYSAAWTDRLRNSTQLSGQELTTLDADLGQFLGTSIRDFLSKQSTQPTAIAVHGHTVFHEPAKGYSTQIGCASHIAAKCGIPVIDNFRQQNIALGGQGAPLVPIGDRDLFPGYDAYLNLGGICNASVQTNQGMLAWDISACNQPLNYLAQQLGFAFDQGGSIAKTGTINQGLLANLNALPYYQKIAPKSLSNQWVQNDFLDIVKSSKTSIADTMRTVVHHIATCIASDLAPYNPKKVLVSGGGAYNTVLVEAIQDATDANLVIPKPDIIEFKEAIVFAYLGALRWLGIPNVLQSYTQASQDVVAGRIVL